MTTLRKALTVRFTSTGHLTGQDVADRIGVKLIALRHAMKPLQPYESDGVRHTGYLEVTTTPAENWHIVVKPETLERLIEVVERDAKNGVLSVNILDRPLE